MGGFFCIVTVRSKLRGRYFPARMGQRANVYKNCIQNRVFFPWLPHFLDALITHRYNDPICFLANPNTQEHTHTRIPGYKKQRGKRKATMVIHTKDQLNSISEPWSSTPSHVGRMMSIKKKRTREGGPSASSGPSGAFPLTSCDHPSLCSAMLQRVNEVTPRCTPPPSPVLLLHL